MSSATAELIGAWLPFIALLFAFGFFLRRINAHYRGHVDEVNAVNKEIVDTNREMIAELREIKQVLKDRK